MTSMQKLYLNLCKRYSAPFRCHYKQCFNTCNTTNQTYIQQVTFTPVNLDSVITVLNYHTIIIQHKLYYTVGLGVIKT